MFDGHVSVSRKTYRLHNKPTILDPKSGKIYVTFTRTFMNIIWALFMNIIWTYTAVGLFSAPLGFELNSKNVR